MAEQEREAGLVNPLDKLYLLEKKLTQLIDIIKAEKSLNVRLVEQNEALTAQLRMLENTLLSGNKSIEELQHEREVTRAVVDELLASIDNLMRTIPADTDVMSATADTVVTE